MASTIYWTKNKNKYGFPVIIQVPKPKQLAAASFAKKKMESFRKNFS